MSVIVMICFARSGGTVLNQCLGSLPDVVMLSEVNPLGGGSGKGDLSYKTIQAQAKHWYKINLQSNDFAEGILELEKICNQENKKLIVRDWSFVNFVPFANNNCQPPNKLLTLEYLEKKCDVIPFAFVRDSIDVWISRGCPDISFFQEYERYINSLVARKIEIFKYEDFCINPQKVIQKICNFTGISYSDSYKNYFNFTKVNGDIQIVSRGNRNLQIRPLLRKNIKINQIEAVNQCQEMIKVNELLGYPTSYFGVKRENLLFKIIEKACNSIIKF